MSKKFIMGVVIILIVIGFLIWNPVFEKPEIKCGDNICSLMEDCNTCIEDCGCSPDEFCNTVGVCKKTEVCGDEVCSEQERINEDCCEDCGCFGERICNKITQKCQEKIIMGDDEINNIVQNYLSQNSLTGTIIEISDSYYKQQAVKIISIDCRTQELEYPCEVVLFINEEGNIIDEMKSA
ncbi:MAG: hypothetical protein KJ858_05260 [Nanoarchaeota archaeon]|nr:hypothetical protein [Nanoarchaeota archaeon]